MPAVGFEFRLQSLRYNETAVYLSNWASALPAYSGCISDLRPCR